MDHKLINQHEKWVRATVGIECVMTNEQQLDRLRQINSTDPAEVNRVRQEVDRLSSRRDRIIGTGIFFKHRNKHYLISARHMLMDPTARRPDSPIWTIFVITNLSGESNIAKKQFIGTNLIMSNDSLSTMIDGVQRDYFAFTDEATDVAVIEIDHVRVVPGLIAKGYQPLTVDDINVTNVSGKKMVAYGFPDEFSMMGIKQFPVPAAGLWESLTVRVPVYSQGLVSKWEENAAQFEGEIFTYHGFSGGPIVSDGKLIGITKGAYPNTITIDETHKMIAIEAHQTFAKIKYAIELVKEIENRDHHF